MDGFLAGSCTSQNVSLVLRSTVTYLSNVRLANRRRHCWPHRRMVFFVVCPPPLSFPRRLHCTRFSRCSAVACLLLFQSSLGRFRRVGYRWVDCSAKDRSQSRGWTVGSGSFALRRLRSGLIRVARSLSQLASVSHTKRNRKTYRLRLLAALSLKSSRIFQSPLLNGLHLSRLLGIFG